MADEVLVEIVVPQVGEAIAEATLVRWLVQAGETIRKGDVLFEVDTDKAVVEIESFVDGTLVETVVDDDTPVSPGERVAVARAQREAVPLDATIIDETHDAGVADGAGDAQPSEPVTPASDGRAPVVASRDGRVAATPRARRVADELGVDLHDVGSASSGPVTEDDVRQHAAADGREGSGHADGQAGTGLTRLQQAVARATTASTQRVPHFYLDASVDVGPVERHRASSDEGASITAYVVLACARVLQREPRFNASFIDGRLVPRDRPRVGVAVATPEGLEVPLLADLADAHLDEVAVQLRAAIERARSHGLSGQDLQPRSMTVSNLGMYGVERFHAVINEPDPFLLSVGAVTEVPILRDGELVAQRRMGLSLAVDHRAADGASAAQFLAHVGRLLEDPEALTTVASEVGGGHG